MTRKRKFLWVFASLLFLILAGLLFLSQTDFSGETARIIQDGIAEKLGYQLDLDEPEGNPLTGFSAKKLVLRDGETVLATAGEVRLKLSLSTFREGHPVISRISVTDVDLTNRDLTRIAQTMRDGEEGSALKIDRVQARHVRLQTPGGLIRLDEGLARFREDSIDVELALGLLGRKCHLLGTLAKTDRGLNIVQAKGDIDGAPLELSGRLFPSPEVTASVDKLSVKTLPLLFPALNPESYGGTVSVETRIAQGPSGFTIGGNMTLPDAVVGGFRFHDTHSLWSYDSGYLLFKDIDGNINGSPLLGELGMLFRREERILWTIKAQGDDLRVGAWKSRFSWLDPFSGSIASLAVDLKGPSDRFQGKVTLGGGNMTLMGKTFQKLTGSVDLALSDRISLDLNGSWRNSPVAITGKVTPRADPDLAIDIASRAFSLKDLRELSGWLEKMTPQGDVAGILQIRGTRDKPRLGWKLRSDRIRLKGELLEGLSIEGETGQNLLVISVARGIWRGGSIQARGNLKGLATPGESHLEMEGDLNDLPLKSFSGTLPMRGTASGTWTLSGDPEDTVMKADLSVEKPFWGKLGADRLSFSGKLKGKELLLDDITAKGFMKGTVKGKGTLTFEEMMAPTFDMSGTLAGIDMKLMAGPLALKDPDFSGNMEGDFRLTGNGHAPLLEMNTRVHGVDLFRLPLGEASGDITWSGDKISLNGWKSSLWGGDITLSGQVRPDEAGGGLKLNGSFSDLDLLLASQAFQAPVKLSGKASGTFGLSGPQENPVLDLKAGAPQFFLDAFGTTDAKIRAKGPLSAIEIETFEALVGKSKLSGKGLITLKLPWEFRFQLEGEELDLAAMTHNVARGDRLTPEGKGSLYAEGTLNTKGLTGEGRINAPSVKLFGLQFEDLQIPFVLLENYLTVEDGKGTLYGGPMETQWTLGLREEQWGGKISVKGADLAPALRDAFNPEGQVSGNADFTLHLSGTYGKAFLLDGTGALDVRDGQVKEFSSQEKLAEVLDFRSLSASFSIDGKTLYLLPGSRVSAPPGNKLYRYISLDGSIIPGGPLDLSGYGDVNLQALNSFLGALQGLFAAGDNSQERIQQFVGGLLGGVTNSKNFREIEFAIEGDWKTPKLTQLQTVTSGNSGAISPIPASSSDPDEKSGSDRISLKIEIPVGEGGAGETNGMGDQIKQQILEQILRQILGPEDDEDLGDGGFSD